MPKVNLEKLIKNRKAINLCTQMVELNYSQKSHREILKDYLNPLKRLFGWFERLDIELEYLQLMPKIGNYSINP